MKKFVFKTLLFLSPFIVLQLLLMYGYNTKGGDLLRVGQIYEMFPSYRNRIQNELENQVYFDEINDITIKDKKIKYLLIGDSFTNDKTGYKNFLGFLSEGNVSSLNSNFSVNDNPLQTLNALIKTDFFKNNEIEYVVIQAVERYFSSRTYGFNPDLEMQKSKIEVTNPQDFKFVLFDQEFPSKTIFTFPYHTFRYLNEEEDFGLIYRFNTNIELFSVDKKEVLCYHDDFDNIEANNWHEVNSKLNAILNDFSEALAKEKVKLIFLPAPNKLTAYYDYIVPKEPNLKPVFLSGFENLSKKYIYVNPIKSIDKFIQSGRKDFYFYDDTHWSYFGSKAVAEQIISETN